MSEEGRRRMIEMDLPRAGVTDARVVAAMGRVQRERFVPEALRRRSYEDRPLPIGHGQTISQPAVVGIMTQLAKLEANARVLEVGTGCGYQTAVLAELASRVYSVERVPALAKQARENLAAVGVTNVELHIGDKHRGWPDKTPFDTILITAAPPHIPAALVDQLAEGGRLVVPVGEGWQDLLVLEKRGGAVREERHGKVRFVPMLPGVIASNEGEA